MAVPVPDDETRQHGHATLSAGAIVAINFGVATTLLLGAFLLLYLVADEPRIFFLRDNGGRGSPPIYCQSLLQTQ